MKAVRLFLLLTLLTFNFLQAQETKNIVRFSPLRLLDPFNPGIELAYERYLSPKKSISFSATYLNKIFQLTNNDNLNGFKLSGEYKCFVTEETKSLRFYFSANLVFNKSNYVNVSRFYKVGDTTFNTTEFSFNYHRKSLALNANIGFQKSFSNHWILDVSAGAGAKCNIVTTSNKPDEKVYSEVQKPMLMIRYEEGWLYLPNLQLQCTLGYRF